MPTLYIREYERMAETADGIAQVGHEPAAAMQKFTISGTSAQSAALNVRTKYVRLWSDALCYVEFGANPTAVTATSMPLAASAPEYFGVTPEASLKIAGVT